MNTEEKLFDNLRKIIIVLLPIPLIVGAVGYYNEGLPLADAIYYGVRLYGLEWEGGVNNKYIEIARWTAPLLTAAGLAAFIESVYVFLHNKWIVFLHKDTTAIYSSSGRGRILNHNIPNSVVCAEKPLKHMKNHIILFDSDKENLLFYQRHKSFFQNGKYKSMVYLFLNEVDSNMLKQDFDNVSILNANDIIARALWKTVKLWNCAEKHRTQKVVILGFDALGQRILRFGLQMNLYAKQQCMEYHIFGNSELFEASHRYFQTMNRDTITYHSEEDEDKWSILEKADYIIVSKPATIELLQSLYYGCEKANIYYYSPANEKVTDYIKTDRLCAFGEDQLIYSNEYIKTDQLYEAAKKLNYRYISSQTGAENKSEMQTAKEMEEEWRKLDGFTKGSNISSSDYSEVIRELGSYGKENEDIVNLEELAELEHIRWCRYHLLNGWKYGVPADGKNKDMEKRIHKCICPYAELSEEEKEKDRQVIKNDLKSE